MKKILMCAESHNINSGFGRYTKEILTRLSKNPDYQIAEFACYADDSYISNVPWKVYPNAIREDHKDFQFYKSNPVNQFGQWRFDKVVLHFKPDIVFDIRDYWMFSYQEMSPLLKYFHWVIAPTIDSIPQKTEWLTTFENADIVLTHTDWALNYLRSLNRSINIMGSVADSVDTEVFKPVPWSKSYQKTKYGIPSDAIVIGSVMRNQKRKLIAELFASLRGLLEITQNNKIYLYLHTSYPESQGWDIPELLHEYDVYNNVFFTYYNPTSKQIYCSPFKGSRIPSPDGHASYCYLPNVIHGVSNEQLTEIYNLFDIYVQYAICEGLGIPQLEATSCGIPLFAINYSGMEEILQKVDGVPIDCVLTKEMETGSNRATPINDDLIQKILHWINLDKKTKKEISTKTRKLLVEHYSWDKTAQQITQIFDTLQPKNKWDEPMLISGASVPDNLSNRAFVNFIVDNILCEPRLKKTYFIQNFIKNLDETTDNKTSNHAARQKFIQAMEVYLNNKIFCEKVRNGEIDLTKENNDFLNK